VVAELGAEVGDEPLEVFDLLPSADHSRANREQLRKVLRILSESQGQNLAVTDLYVPYSLDVQILALIFK